MAGGEPVTLFGYRFMAKPLSRWRRLSGDFLPHWQASKPRFILTVTREGDHSKEQAYNWFVLYHNNATLEGHEVIPSMKTGDKASFIIGGNLLGYTGDTLLILPPNLTANSPSQFKTLYTFHVTPKVWVFLSIAAGFLAGLLAGLFQWLFGLCN
jgi:hypothetical protein